MIGTAQEKRFAILGHRDTTETGLDPTRFRMFSSTQGRWLSKDPKAGQVCNPQTLNRYAYVRNSPANLIDPRGTNGGDRGGGGFFGPGNGCDPSDATCGSNGDIWGPGGDIFGGGLYTGSGFYPETVICWCVLVTPVPFDIQGIACSYACLCEDFSIAAFEKRTNSWACFFVPCPKLVNIEIINLPGYVPVKEVIWTWPRPFCYP